MCARGGNQTLYMRDDTFVRLSFVALSSITIYERLVAGEYSSTVPASTIRVYQSTPGPSSHACFGHWTTQHHLKHVLIDRFQCPSHAWRPHFNGLLPFCVILLLVA